MNIETMFKDDKLTQESKSALYLIKKA